MISDICYDFLFGNIQRHDLPQELRAYIDEPVYAKMYGEEVRDLCQWIVSAAHDPRVPLVAITATIGHVLHRLDLADVIHRLDLAYGESNAEP